MKSDTRRQSKAITSNLNIPGVSLILLRNYSQLKQIKNSNALLIVTSGCYLLHKKKGIIPVKKGTIIILKENTHQTLKFIKKKTPNSSGLLCFLDSDFITSFHKLFRNVVDDAINDQEEHNDSEMLFLKTTPSLQLCIESLAHHFFDQLKNEQLLLEIKIKTFLISIVSEYSEFGQYLTDASGLNSRNLKAQVKHLLMSHVNRDISIDELAKTGGFSCSVLKKMSREFLGMPPRQWINKERLKQSTVLLRNKNNSIDYICHRIGFQSQSYFSVIFKREYGMTPKQFQKNLNETNKNPNETNKKI